jgi:5-methylcytosine-specific restriction endonuclease McrA
LRSLSDADLLRRLLGATRQSRWDEVDLITLIAEVDVRKLYAREAKPSMFLYCTEVLHLSEQEAYLRITVARASREHPSLLTMLRDGRLHLSGIARLTKYLTRENRDEVLKRAVHKSRREIEKLVAELAGAASIMRSSVPDGDLGKIIDEAVTEKLERLEARRFARTKSPRKSLAETDTTPGSRHIPAAVRRAVYERDGGRCTYQDARGRGCTARDRLEFHYHRQPFGRGGEHSVYNIRLMCRAHNQLLAEQDYGEQEMARFRRGPGRVSETRGTYRVPGGG